MESNKGNKSDRNHGGQPVHVDDSGGGEHIHHHPALHSGQGPEEVRRQAFQQARTGETMMWSNTIFLS